MGPPRADCRKPADGRTDGSGGFTLYSEGDELYDAMLADIGRAAASIRFETYIFADDEVGERFVDALIGAAARGVATTLRLDAIGSWGVNERSLARLRGSGVRLLWSRAWSWRQPLEFHRRNHRKLLIVDEAAAYLGGFNVHRESSRRVVGAKRWRDTHVRLRGALVRDAVAVFDRYGRLGALWEPSTLRGFYLVPNRTARCRHRLRCAFNDRFREARGRVWLTTPYFVPDRRSQSRLCEAARRGVDVRVLLPGKSDVPLAQWASRAAYSRLLAAGVRVYEYQPRVLHSKTVLVDRDWATIGTANFDYRSFFVNDELNLIGEDAAFNEEIAVLFERDLEDAREVTSGPWRQRGVHAMLAETIGWWARRWL